jgi:hypothetical protein
LKAAWFQPLSLSSENPVSKFAFKLNLYRYSVVATAVRRVPGGVVTVYAAQSSQSQAGDGGLDQSEAALLAADLNNWSGHEHHEDEDEGDDEDDEGEVGLYKLRIQLNHSLKAPGFNLSL